MIPDEYKFDEEITAQTQIYKDLQAEFMAVH
jgi:hypothetical protein